MKPEFNRRYTTIAIYAFLVLSAVVLFWQVITQMRYFQSILSSTISLLRPFIYAFGIAYILNPVLKWIELSGMHRVPASKPKRGLAILLSYLLAAGALTIFVLIVLPRLIESISGLAAKTFKYLNSSDTWLPLLLRFFPELDVNATIMQYFNQYAADIVSTAYSMLSQLLPWLSSFSAQMASGLLNIVVGIIISIYMLMNKEQFCAGIKRIIYASLPNKKADWLLELTSDANRIFGGFISGKILDSLIIGLLCFAGMSLLGIPNALLVSVIVGVTNVIPYFGPFIGAIPSFFIILIEDPIKSLVFLVFVLILQQFDGNILGPKILGDSTGLSAFWVIFSIMLFGGIYGFLGMFLGVPIFSVLFMLAGRLVNNFLQKRGMPTDVENYYAPDASIPRGKKSDASAKTRRGAHTVQPVSLEKRAPPKDEDEDEDEN